MIGKWLPKTSFSGAPSKSAFENFAAIVIRKKISFRFILTAILIFGIGISSSIAQDRVSVSGVVTDTEDNSPLPGVSVTVPGSQELIGTTIGTTTNLDGEYTVRVPQDLNRLRFSFIGYKSMVVSIDGRTEINIELQQDVRLLDDVVVVGYGNSGRAANYRVNFPGKF